MSYATVCWIGAYVVMAYIVMAYIVMAYSSAPHGRWLDQHFCSYGLHTTSVYSYDLYGWWLDRRLNDAPKKDAAANIANATEATAVSAHCF